MIGPSAVARVAACRIPARLGVVVSEGASWAADKAVPGPAISFVTGADSGFHVHEIPQGVRLICMGHPATA
jgi:hypothetical protein